MSTNPFVGSIAVIKVLVLSLTLLSGRAATQPPSALPILLDAQADAARAERDGKPLILFFSLPNCQFCHVIRRNYLLPLLDSQAARDQPLIREIDLSSTQDIVGMDGSGSTHRELAQSFRVRVAPTVLFVGTGGRLLTEPIVGGDVSGLYGGYLDNAFAASTKILQKK